MRLRFNWILVLIMVVGLGLRVVNLAQLPMYGDEMTILLDANSLLHTGQDELGYRTPLTFNMGAGRPAGYVYSSIPMVALFGENQYGVRALSVVSGVILIGLMFWLGRKLFNRQVGLVLAGLMAVSPWSLSLSRVGFEANYALMLTVLGVIGLFQAKKQGWWLLISALAFGVAIHTYPTFKLTIPLLGAATVWFIGWKGWWVKKLRWWVMIAVVVLGLAYGLAIDQTLSAGSEQRFSSLSIFNQPDIAAQVTKAVNRDRSDSQGINPATALFHNKELVYANTYLGLYWQNLSPDFLWLHGDGNPRHNPAEWGELYLFEVVTVAAGLIWLFWRQQRLGWYCLSWILIAPLPVALVGGPHALRADLLLPGLVIVSGVGLWRLWLAFGTWARVVLVALVVLNLLFFGERLYVVAPHQSLNFWSAPAKAAAELAIEQRANYAAVILSDEVGDIEYAYPVYAQVPATEVMANNLNHDRRFGLKQFGNVYIGHLTPEVLATIKSQISGPVLVIDQKGSHQLP